MFDLKSVFWLAAFLVILLCVVRASFGQDATAEQRINSVHKFADGLYHRATSLERG
jgi:hypothetical protein